MESKNNHILEAEQITNYLLSVPVQESERNKYVDAMQKLNIQFSEYENALWKSMMKSKWRMASIDAGLAKQPSAQKIIYHVGNIRSITQLYFLFFVKELFFLLYIQFRFSWNPCCVESDDRNLNCEKYQT